MIITKTKKLLPFAGILIITVLYLIFGAPADNAITIAKSLTLIGFGYAAAYTDIKTRTIPNKLVLYMFLTWSALMSLYVILNTDAAVTMLIQSLISGAAAGAFLLFIYLVSNKGIGGGDIKFITVMGLYITAADLMQLLFITSLLTVVFSVILLISKRATMKTAIPLIPFLYAGLLFVIFI